MERGGKARVQVLRGQRPKCSTRPAPRRGVALPVGRAGTAASPGKVWGRLASFGQRVRRACTRSDPR
eukprot:14176279-Alexandrium_andersonii.AAC.1